MQSHVCTIEIIIVWPIFKRNPIRFKYYLDVYNMIYDMLHWKIHYFHIGMLFLECILVPFRMSLLENLHIWWTLTLSYLKYTIEWCYPNKYMKKWLYIVVLIIIEITM